MKPFECPECQRKFTTKGSLNRHLKNSVCSKPSSIENSEPEFVTSESDASASDDEYAHSPKRRRIREPGTFMCPVAECGQSYQHHGHLVRHIAASQNDDIHRRHFFQIHVPQQDEEDDFESRQPPIMAATS
jgi:hypothetical protein